MACTGSGGPPMHRRAAGSTSRATRPTSTVGTLPVGDLSGTIHPPFSFSSWFQTVYSDSATPTVRPGMMVHTALQSCARPQPSPSSVSAYLYALFSSFPSPLPFPPRLASVTLILHFLKLFYTISVLCLLQVNRQCCKLTLKARHLFSLPLW
jgi:hypothetical protein